MFSARLCSSLPLTFNLRRSLLASENSLLTFLCNEGVICQVVERFHVLALDDDVLCAFLCWVTATFIYRKLLHHLLGWVWADHILVFWGLTCPLLRVTRALWDFRLEGLTRCVQFLRLLYSEFWGKRRQAVKVHNQGRVIVDETWLHWQILISNKGSKLL